MYTECADATVKLNAIGVTKITGDAFISLRGDYGATFRGDMNLIDCTFLNYNAYNTNRGGSNNTNVNTSGIIVKSGFAGNNSNYRTPEQRQASYDAEYAKVYAEKMDAYAEDIAEGKKTTEQAKADAAAAAKTSAEKMAMQGGYWLWDFGYDCYLPETITIKNFKSAGTKNLYLFPKLPNSVFEYNYDPENETALSVTNVYNITKQINIVEESADKMPIKIEICSAKSTSADYSMLYSIPINYGCTWVNPFE